MDDPHDHAQPTRMLFLGEESLAAGFRLIGCESHPDPSPEDVDRILRELRRNREKALVIVDDVLMRAEIPHLRQARREGGRIVVIAVPRLTAPPVLTSEVAERLTTLFGVATLEFDGNGNGEKTTS